jgi:hypothetical protein
MQLGGRADFLHPFTSLCHRVAQKMYARSAAVFFACHSIGWIWPSVEGVSHYTPFITFQLSFIVVYKINNTDSSGRDYRICSHWANVRLIQVPPYTSFTVCIYVYSFSSSSYLWTHVTLAILYLPLGIVIMRRFSVTIKSDESDTSVSRTLMITKIPCKDCDSADLHRHFRWANQWRGK